MLFNVQQNPHRQLRSIIAEKTSKLVCWVGSGLSAEANLPTWFSAQEASGKVSYGRKPTIFWGADSQTLKSAADHAEKEENFWIAFQILREHLGASSYRSGIREALQPALTAACPEAYRYVWKLGGAGVLNLNLDRLATKALGEVFPGRLPTEFSGPTRRTFPSLSQESSIPLSQNLHGIGDDASTWVFTKRDLNYLLNSDGYQTFHSELPCDDDDTLSWNQHRRHRRRRSYRGTYARGHRYRAALLAYK